MRHSLALFSILALSACACSTEPRDHTSTGSLRVPNGMVIETDSIASPTFRVSGHPALASPAEIPAFAVVTEIGNPVPFRVVADGIVQVGTARLPGSVDGRTITFPAGITVNGKSHVLELRCGGDALCGRLRYQFVTSNGRTMLEWRTAGVALSP